MYFTFPFLDGNNFSNFYIAGFIISKYFTIYGNEICLKKLIAEIKTLENDGVVINLSGEPVKIRIFLGLIMVDNLGVNSIRDFSKSFSAFHFCRFCTASKSETHTMCVNNLNRQRNIENYDYDLINKVPRESEINQYSTFNDVKSFHVTENFLSI